MTPSHPAIGAPPAAGVRLADCAAGDSVAGFGSASGVTDMGAVVAADGDGWAGAGDEGRDDAAGPRVEPGAVAPVGAGDEAPIR
jgi:hypothetical protein